MGRVGPWLVVGKRVTRCGLRRFSTKIIVVPSIVLRTSMRVPSIVSRIPRFVPVIPVVVIPVVIYCLLDSGHRDIGHGRSPISFGCRCGSGRHRGGNRLHDVDHPMTVGARYPYYGRIDTRPAVSSCF